ncbi:MAG: ATP-binding response regulator [Burkholderiales bacterium]
MHALNLFAAQLRTAADPDERNRLIVQIGAAIGAMNELFDSLLDMSKLDAGVLQPNITEFPAAHILARMETTFGAIARQKGLRLRVLPSRAWVRSDFILLERIVLNLVSNAVRYTVTGGVVVACRRRGDRLHFMIRDTGPGIAEDQKQNIFREFYQVAVQDTRHRGGLGLGLAIVDRLSSLLDHPVEVASQVGKGSCFFVSVPIAPKGRLTPELSDPANRILDRVSGRLIVVIDDDALVLDAMGGILASWGGKTVTASTDEAALAELRALGRQPDVIVSDYRLANGKTGIVAIERLRAALGIAVPAFIISGDTAPGRLRDATQGGYFVLHKPVAPMALRAMLNRLLEPAEAHPKPVGASTISRRPQAGNRVRRPR